jgi:hypothetical protein
MASLPVTIIAVIIDKPAFSAHHHGNELSGVYDFAMKKGLEAVHLYLGAKGQTDFQTPIIVECRGRKEDKELELSFRRFYDTTPKHSNPLPFELVMVPKASNSAGLQLADLIARPIGLHHLRPNQANRSFEILQRKLHRGLLGDVEGLGLLRVP